MKDREIDNEIIERKKKIDIIDDKIDVEKKKLKQMEGIWDELISLNKNLNKCIDILSRSMRAPNSKYIYDDMRASNNGFLVKATVGMEEYTEVLKKNIHKLSDEKDQLIRQQANKNNENKKQ